MKELFEKTSINGLELKNRFIRSATWERMADDKGHLTDRLLNVYEKLADGGAAAIITGYAFVIEDEQPNARMMGIYNDSFIEEYKKLTDAVHKRGSKIILQIVYGGSFTWYNTAERVIWGPSAVTNKVSNVTPKEMTLEEIKILIEAFGDAALRAKKSGFDGVEIHGAHSYLLNMFLSPFFNVREDEYGGSAENRARIIYDIYDNARAKVGKEFPILIKLNCSDFMGDKGFTFDDCKEICRNLAAKGIDAIEISGGPVFRAPKPEKDPSGFPEESIGKESYFAAYAKEIAQTVDVPVILVGGNRSVETMENLLNDSSAVYFSISRPLLSEPDLINKWSRDRNYKPRCVSCNKCFDENGNTCYLDRA
ncbi:MAG TPA: NADH:flavin oxidoreductase [Spirochaetota bacterium]|nr:NADH:flavin oxidoreductase [Spirochaetota bacterium]HPJ42835.1 NADH:flavin oxidoreductase [Spirochaetota bacterium]HPR38266.1 NADH:flavin oxidoreductase [Spirochaetota bacterium]